MKDTHYLRCPACGAQFNWIKPHYLQRCPACNENISTVQYAQEFRWITNCLIVFGILVGTVLGLVLTSLVVGFLWLGALLK